MNQREGLKNYHDDVLFYDDFSPEDEDMDEDKILAMRETDAPRTMRVLDSHVTKKKGIKQIIAMNDKAFAKFAHTIHVNQYSRRIIIV